MSALARLRSMEKAAAWLQEADDTDVQLVGVAMLAWLDSGAQEPLGRALKLQTRGGISPAQALTLSTRDRALRRLYEECWPDFSAAKAAKLMAESFFAYETRRWPRESDHIAAPSAEPAATWWRLLREDTPPPTWERIRQILAA